MMFAIRNKSMYTNEENAGVLSFRTAKMDVFRRVKNIETRVLTVMYTFERIQCDLVQSYRR